MKTSLLFLLSIFNFVILSAQVTVGRYDYESVKKFREGEFALIKSKPTVFISDAYPTSVYEDILKEVWTVTPYQVISRSEFDKNRKKYITDQNSLFLFGVDSKSATSMSGNDSNYTLYYFSYFYPTDIKEKKGKIHYEANQVAQMFLYGNTAKIAADLKAEKYSDLGKDFWYYKPGYLKNYLRQINNALVSEKEVNTYENTSEPAKLKELAKATLYIPQMFKTVRMWSAPRANAEKELLEALKEYKYKYEFIEDAALEDKILKGDDPVYYLQVTRLPPYKILSVVNSRTGEVIFSCKKMDGGAIDHLLKELNKTIAKS